MKKNEQSIQSKAPVEMQKETSVWKFIFSSFFLFYISDIILEVFVFDPRQNETNQTSICADVLPESLPQQQLPSARFMINLFVSLRKARQETFRCLSIENCSTLRASERASKKV